MLKTPTALAAALVSCAAWAPVAAQTLEAYAVLPADTFESGPTSGQFVTAANGRVPPFTDRQPVQGVSSVLRTSKGDFLVMSDNGFGAQENSADYVLRVHRISPDFKTKTGGSGAVTLESFFTLRDPDFKINFPIVAEKPTYYPTSSIPVDIAIVRNRYLTGADFDIESVREAHDGTLWFGDEFGPFLLHTDATGKVLEAPIPLPGVFAPQNPFLAGRIPNLPTSRGFEGMAITPDGKTLYPLLEGALTTDPDQRRLTINEFDIESRQYTGRQWFYRLEAPIQTGQSIGDMTAITKSTFVIIERDGGQGATALFKRIYKVDLNDVDANGFLVKHQVADLLHIDDPDNLGGLGPVFTFPFVTIESVIPLDDRRLGVLNDNNYPGSSGRTPGQPDSNEFIIIRLDEPLSH
ncbi:MAG TPA: esterase-like activity of phytase family protein [Vicinamibacterales bacterium]|nr:esterase-like activity of phytase family protein [Vicinamibacterales bacterium]